MLVTLGGQRVELYLSNRRLYRGKLKASSKSIRPLLQSTTLASLTDVKYRSCDRSKRLGKVA